MFARRRKSLPVTSPHPMRAMAIVRGDGGERLQSVRTDINPPARGEVQVKVAYAGVNRADLMQLEGNYKPPEGASDLLGLEVSGAIASLGADVIGWSIGEQVCALLSGGGYAEYVNVPAEQILALPTPIDLKEAASLPEACATTYMALHWEGRLKAGERLLLHGGTSGVGIMMCQIARAWGAEVYATAGGPEKCAFLRKLGVRPIDHRAGPFGEQLLQATSGEGVDVIVDILGAPQLATHFKLLRKGGRLVTLAFMEGNVVESLKVSAIMMKQLSWSGATLRGRNAAEKAELIEGVRKTIWPHLATGTIRPFIDSVFPLESAEKALLHMQERLHIGKILLEMPPQEDNGPPSGAQGN